MRGEKRADFPCRGTPLAVAGVQRAEAGRLGEEAEEEPGRKQGPS